MYLSYWGFKHEPLSAELDHDGLFHGKSCREALARLNFLVKHHWRLGVLLGDMGTGKSAVLEGLDGELRRRGTVTARLSLLSIDTRELLWQLAAALGTNPASDASSFCLWRLAQEHLLASRYEQQGTVLLLDDADRASAVALEQVARLAVADAPSDAPLTIILAARRDRLRRLGGDLLELVDLRIDLEAWDRADTARFLDEALRRAGRNEAAFDQGAVDRLFELSAGMPRRLVHLARLSLIAGAGKHLTRVDAETVASVHEELEIQRTQLVGV